MRFPSTLLVLTPLLLVSCDTQEDGLLADDPPSVGEELEDVGQELGNIGEPNAAENIGEELGESFEAMGAAITGKDHRTFTDKAAETLDDLDREIDARVAELEGDTDEAAAKAREALAVTKRDVKELRASLEQLEPTEEEWEQVATDLRESIREVANALDREA